MLVAMQSRAATRAAPTVATIILAVRFPRTRVMRHALHERPLQEHDPEKCSRFSDRIMLPQKGGGAPKGAVVDTAGPPTSVAACLCAHGARRFWRTRSPSGALPRLSPKPFGLGSVRSRTSWQRQRITPSATRAASSSQTGVEAGRAGFRTAREWSYEPHPRHRSRPHQSAVTG